MIEYLQNEGIDTENIDNKSEQDYKEILKKINLQF